MEETIKLLKSFSDEIKHGNRFIINHKIVDLFKQIINDFTEIIPKENTVLFRGRINKSMVVVPYTDEEIGMPSASKVLTIGRANPYGINYLYLAEDVDTVISELRPNRDSLITVGSFELLRDIKVVKLSNFAVHEDENICSLALLLGLNFSLPVNKSDANIDYLPTQYFAELCKANKLDGIKFLSSVMNNGNKQHYNITVFNDKFTKCIKREVRRVLSIEYRHRLYE